MNQNLQAFLDMLACCEGTDSPDGYRALFGYTPANNRVFDNSYITHPNIKFPFKQTDGQQNFSTAAGRYQIIYPTFHEYAPKLMKQFGSLSFTPEVQDWLATQFIEKTGAMPDIEAGNLQEAIDKCAGIWASLPASHYSQPKKAYAFAESAYVNAGGVLA